MERLSDVVTRLGTWREEIAQYFQPGNEYGDFKGKPSLAHVDSGAVVRVDSFYSTLNTEAKNLYWSLNEVSVRAEPGPIEGYAVFYLSTNTPNFESVLVQIDEGQWHVIPTMWAVALHRGKNRFRFRSRNTAGILGRVAEVVADYDCESGHTVFTYGVAEPLISPHQFVYEDYRHPGLQFLREKNELDAKVATEGADWERLIPLRTWLKGLWIHGQPLRLPPWDARYIIERGMKGVERFHCVHYSISFTQCCLSLGHVVRMVNMHRGIAEDCVPGKEQMHTPPCDEHVVTEIWSNDLGKWVVFDVDYDCHYTHRGVVLNCLEIHDLLNRGQAGEIRMSAGPHTAAEMGDQTLAKRLSFYGHLSFIMRNNFLSDPAGPIRVAHLVDDDTPPILWWYGEDMTWRHHLMGPVHVAKPYKQVTPVLNDGRLHTAWASDDTPVNHWVEIQWPVSQEISCVVLHWADRGGVVRTSREYRIEVLCGQKWQIVAESSDNQEQSWNIHQFSTVSTKRIRVVQPPGCGHALHPNIMWLRQVQCF